MRGSVRKLLLAVTVAASVLVLADLKASGTDVDPLLEKFLNRSSTSHAYRASRRLEASGRGQSGWLDAQTTYAPETGLHYEITAEGGSGYIRSRVLRSLLEEERQLIARGAAGDVAISPANYLFASDGTDESGLARITLEPRRQERPLVIGRMFVRPDDGELVRVEGRLARTPSFWITRVNIVRSYERINGALLPVLLDSTAQLRFLGGSTLKMTYRYLEIDAQPVIEQDARAAAGDVRPGVSEP